MLQQQLEEERSLNESLTRKCVELDNQNSSDSKTLVYILLDPN